MSDAFFEQMSEEERKEYLEFLKQKVKEHEKKVRRKQEEKTGDLGKSFEDIGKTLSEVREGIPHIKVGGDELKEEDPLTSKIRKWLFIILTILVGGTALILIVWRILARFI